MDTTQVKPLPPAPPPTVTPPVASVTPASAALTGESAEILATTDYLWKIYGVTNDWIKSSDTKAAAVLSANALLTGAAVSAFNVVHGFNQTFLLRHHVVLALAVSALAATAASVGSCLCCIYPRLKSDAPPKVSSLVYFGHIALWKTAEEYEKQVRQTLTNEVQALNQISDQVWVNSRIAKKKLNAVAHAISCFSATLLLILVAVVMAKLS